MSPVYKDRDISANMVNQFLTWPKDNAMSYNPSKYKELARPKKDTVVDSFGIISRIPKCNELLIVGISFQGDWRFTSHVRNTLTKANN